MLLSEAIRLGCNLRQEQAFGHVLHNNGSCALGAAYEGAFGQIEKQNLFDIKSLEKQFPILNKTVTIPIEAGDIDRRMKLEIAIGLLNDVGRWSRQEIANWIEHIEISEESLTKQVLQN